MDYCLGNKFREIIEAVHNMVDTADSEFIKFSLCVKMFVFLWHHNFKNIRGQFEIF